MGCREAAPPHNDRPFPVLIPVSNGFSRPYSLEPGVVMLRREAEVIDAARLMQGQGVDTGGLAINWRELVTFKRCFTDAMPRRSPGCWSAIWRIARHWRTRWWPSTGSACSSRKVSATSRAPCSGWTSACTARGRQTHRDPAADRHAGQCGRDGGLATVAAGKATALLGLHGEVTRRYLGAGP